MSKIISHPMGYGWIDLEKLVPEITKEARAIAARAALCEYNRAKKAGEQRDEAKERKMALSAFYQYLMPRAKP